MSLPPYLLYVGDFIAILLFAILGRRSHGLPTDAAAFAETFQTAAPYLIGWFLVSPWLGAFRPLARQDILSTLRVIGLAFLPAFVVGSIVRALFVGHVSPWTFYVVTFVVLLALLLGWRVLYTFAFGQRF
ncbi:MAG: DUF3054 domain-containing protein [Caldilineae bacterium]|nr:MAG: DUF3054 domain-containing protein [Caldilineae bacterium]